MKTINKLLKFVLLFCFLSVSFLHSSCSSDDKKKVEICNNGIDDDGDGFIDCDDFDCNESPFCAVEICNNGIDDDGDGFIDCDDFDCNDFPGCD
ncbi:MULTISPECIES: hypothetical protein [Flavobacterium]|uniref:Thrombospondin type 3 repeat-containing protein n=1 Tax=Flavobacterium orientale TaxID=1756020 RepID=A0A917DHH8_9FLAO|nr:MULTISPECIES: hypothetical protein [Flavobacterium]GGD35806.1 hypothetical protein GCM10011343_27080 [Flavobacterium orientale]